MMRWLTFALLCLPVMAADYTPDADRRIDWTYGVITGVPGGIPTRDTIFADITQPPYNADNTGVTGVHAILQNAINACPPGQVVYLPAGTYLLGTTINLKSGVVVRGAGKGNTILRWVGGVKGFDARSGVSGPVYSIVSGYSKGSSNIVVNGTSFTVGRMVLIDQLNDPAYVKLFEGRTGDRVYDRRQSQISEIKAVSGSGSTRTLRIWPPLMLEYQASQQPEVLAYSSAWARNIGIEEMTLVNDSSPSFFHISFFGGIDSSWVKNVELKKVGPVGIKMTITTRSTVQGCDFRDLAGNAGAGAGYGVGLDGSFFNVIENNSASNVLNVAILEFNSSGNVIAYNATTNLHFYNATWQVDGITAGHSAWCSWNLFEGNITLKLTWDSRLGNSHYNTSLRNYLTGDMTGKVNNIACFVANTWNRYITAIGNVLGDSKWNSSMIYERSAPNGTSNSEKVIWRLGYFDTNFAPDDPQVKATLVRFKNWDAVTGEIRSDNGLNSSLTIPNSLYRSSKPEWWGDSFDWPSIGPDKTPMRGSNPALRRLQGISEGEPEPQPNRTLTVQSLNISDVPITVSPNDENGQGNGATSFTREYEHGATVSLTAPSSHGGLSFQKWLRGGVDYSINPATSVTLTADTAMTAVYVDPSSGIDWVVSHTGGVNRNNFSGWVGAWISVGVNPLQVSALGRYVTSGNSQTHTLKLVQAANGQDVPGGSVSFNTAGKVAGAINYVDLAAPVTLAADTHYYLVSEEFAGGDVWLDPYTSPNHLNVTVTTDATAPGGVWRSANGSTWTTVNQQNRFYVPVSFRYTTSPPEPPPTTYTLTVASSNPASGVTITVSPNDNSGNGSGSTGLTRTFNENTVVTLTAPATAGGNNFSKWQRDGVDLSTDPQVTITMDGNITLTAIYVTPAPPGPSEFRLIGVRVIDTP